MIDNRATADGRSMSVAVPSVAGISRLSSWWASRYGARLLIEFGLMYALLMVYRFVRTLTSADLVTAFSHSADVQRIESAIGLPREEALQQAVLKIPFGIEFLNRYYVWVHFPSIFALVIGLYVFRPHVYRPVRTLLTAVTFSALVIHLLYPLAPPRMMEAFVDTIQIYGPSVYPPSSFDGVANQIAAMPSLHFGWAAIEALSVIWAFKSRWRWLAIAHPVLMTIAIVSTANHWWADAIVAGMLILSALPLVFFVERRLDRRAEVNDGTRRRDTASASRRPAPIAV